ncbi:TlpA family protein disulfide reductase [Sphingobium subterraneum]|uniref:Thiol-disulfide isomerase/thioredoxin n=1 Tax=Sphingobium subterraneum TaxID=627688 RepID=A0A841J3C7_9SPHN|nr:TlpA disulfide reductase family protein [Sphingobium subterraneum]MBB6124842.1 thiol-disulfide isomerase/thioredoxin [Sphingobium subterraneum]
MSLLLVGLSLGACDRQSAPARQDDASKSAPSNAVTPDEVPSTPETAGAKSASFVIDRSKAGSPLPDFVFADAKSKDVTLSRFAGRPILVNLWATWCAPCVAEMPQLDAIAGAYAKDKLAVLTISQDSLGADKVVPFFQKKGFQHIQPWLDPENQFGFHYATGMLPTSVLYTADGKEIARVVGALDWEGDDAKALIEEAVNGG